MLRLAFLMILGLTLPYTTVAECPSIRDEPVMFPYDKRLFNCVDMYQTPGSHNAIQACISCDGHGQIYYGNGKTDNSPHGQFLPFGSMVVMPGCTFYGFSAPDFQGNVWQYNGPQVVPMIEMQDDHNHAEICGQTVYGFASIKCQCVQKLIECDPKDDYDTVITCDNLDNMFPADCSYTQVIGTTYTAESSESKSVSEQVSAEVELHLGDLFSTKLGYSKTTGYNWAKSTSNTFSTTKSSTMSFTMEPGYKTTVDQVIGYCDGNRSLPNEFRFTTVSKNGTKIVEFYAMGANGQLVEVQRGKEDIWSNAMKEMKMVHHKKRGDAPKTAKTATMSSKTNALEKFKRLMSLRTYWRSLLDLIKKSTK